MSQKTLSAQDIDDQMSTVLSRQRTLLNAYDDEVATLAARLERQMAPLRKRYFELAQEKGKLEAK